MTTPCLHATRVFMFRGNVRVSKQASGLNCLRELLSPALGKRDVEVENESTSGCSLLPSGSAQRSMGGPGAVCGARLLRLRKATGHRQPPFSTFFFKTSINAIKRSAGKSNFLFNSSGPGRVCLFLFNCRPWSGTVYGFLGIFQINSVSSI